MVVAVLSIKGDQLPEIPLLDVVGKASKFPPLQIADIVSKVGVTLLLTTTVIVAFDAHCPPFGVKVYVDVAALFTAGDHVPVIPIEEVVGKLKFCPEQIGAI